MKNAAKNPTRDPRDAKGLPESPMRAEDRAEGDEADETDEDTRPTKPRSAVSAILGDKSEDEIKEELDRRTFADNAQNTEGDTSNHSR